MPEFKHTGGMQPMGNMEFLEVINQMILGYLECAAWSSTGPNDEDLGRYEFSLQAQSKAAADCAEFLRLPRAMQAIDQGPWTPSSLGHDFWLTRNGHGAGFWDRYSVGTKARDIGEDLSESAKLFGTVDAYVGDDQLIYLE